MRKTLTYLQRKLERLRKKEAFKIIQTQFNRWFDEESGSHPAAAFANTMEDFYKAAAQGDVDAEDVVNNDEDNPDWYTGMHRYESIQEIETRLQKGKAISGFIKKDDAEESTICVGFGRGRYQWEYIQLKYYPHRFPFEICGFHFCRFERCGSGSFSAGKATIRKSVDCYCLLLPFLQKDANSFAQQFTIVTDTWLSLHADGTLGVPELSRTLFEERRDE